MSSRLRLTLALVGLVIILLSTCAVGYTLWPTQTVREQVTLAPTWFAPPR